MAHGPNQARHLFLWIKFYWNTTMLLCFYIVYDGFCSPMTEVGVHDSDCVVCKA